MLFLHARIFAFKFGRPAVVRRDAANNNGQAVDALLGRAGISGDATLKSVTQSVNVEREEQ